MATVPRAMSHSDPADSTPQSAPPAALPPTDSHVRSLLKGLTWRCVATATTVLIAFSFSGDVELALSIGSVEFVAKFLIYYAHERAWQLVPR